MYRPCRFDTFAQYIYRPIHDAIESGCLDLVKVLISHGADPLAEFGEKTPVEYALSIDQKEIYKYLEGLTEDISSFMHCCSTYWGELSPTLVGLHCGSVNTYMLVCLLVAIYRKF